MSKIQTYVQNMDKHIDNNHGLFLLMLIFAQTTKKVLSDLNMLDESDPMVAIGYQIQVYVP